MPFPTRVSALPNQPRRLLVQEDTARLALNRLPWVLGAMLAWAFALALRLVWLQIKEHSEYRLKAERQHIANVDINPIRGEIRDRKGESLAISLRVDSLFATPSSFYPDFRKRPDQERQWGDPDRSKAREVARSLAPILEIPEKKLMDKLLAKTPFVWLERQLIPSRMAIIRNQNIEGVGFLPESKRFYPRAKLASQIIGFTDIDGIGQLGIERIFDKEMAGKKGLIEAMRDARGRLLMGANIYKKIPVNGSTLQLSLDATIQNIVEQALEEGMETAKPKTIYAVVVDPHTGEILSMAGTPSFDPNQLLPKKFRHRSESELSPSEREELQAEKERQKAARKVHPVEDSYEPGSTMKIFTASMALEERKVHLGEPINCMGGRWTFNKTLTITDTHHYGGLTFEEVLWKSSNIGAAKIGLRLDPITHYQYLKKFGFGEPTGLHFPGETSGRLIAPDRWSSTTQPTFCYGYGLNASPLQVLMAGCAIANGGKLMQPLLVKKIFNDRGELMYEYLPKVRSKVISEETSTMMREVLKGVITDGTAKKAKLEGNVEAFGKTGTSRKIVNGSYDARRHFASFMGFFPSDRPQYGILIMMDEPISGMTGGDVAAPVFKRIGDAILRYRQSDVRGEDTPIMPLALKDWPTSETDEAVIQVERGKVPKLVDLAPKTAIQRILIVEGVPEVTFRDTPGPRASRVVEQHPPPGTRIQPGSAVKIVIGGGV